MEFYKPRLDNEVAVVTGASKGIGRTIALNMADAGAQVVLVARSAQELKCVGGELRAMGADCLEIAADICKKEDIDGIYEQTMARYGRCDVLVNNAGRNIRKTNSYETSEEEIRQVMDLNLKALYNVTMRFGKQMCDKQKGSIVNIASIAGVFAVRTGIAYAMSKAAVIQMTKYLALEWGEHSVRVNAIAPWYFMTPLTAPVLENDAYRNKVLGRTMLPRLGDMRDISALTVFLASEAAGFITAQTICCDGGMKEYGFDPTK